MPEVFRQFTVEFNEFYTHRIKWIADQNMIGQKEMLERIVMTFMDNLAEAGDPVVWKGAQEVKPLLNVEIDNPTCEKHGYTPSLANPDKDCPLCKEEEKEKCDTSSAKIVKK